MTNYKPMKTKLLLLSSLAVATAFSLTSCSGDDSSAENDDAAAPPQEASASYPLDVCVVSGKELGSMGEPHVIMHEGTEVRFCCDQCVPKFEENPEKYLAMIEAGQADETGQN